MEATQNIISQLYRKFYLHHSEDGGEHCILVYGSVYGPHFFGKECVLNYDLN